MTVPKHWQKLDNGLYLDPEAGVLLAPIERLRPDPGQPRKHFDPVELAELKADIEAWRARGRGLSATGLMHPIMGRWEPGAALPDGSIKRGAKIDIVDGERRWRTLFDKKGQPLIKWVPLVLDDLSAKEARDAALRTSIHRKGLQPIEEAHAFAAKMDEEGWGIRPVAKHYNKSSGYVENRLAILVMGPDVRALVGTQEKVLSSAKVIDKVKDSKVRQALIEAVEQGAPFSEIEERAEPFIGRDQKPAKKTLARMPKIDIGAYLDNAIHNAEEVRDALKATPMPKGFYTGQVNPKLKRLRAVLGEIEGK